MHRVRRLTCDRNRAHRMYRVEVIIDSQQAWPPIVTIISRTWAVTQRRQLDKTVACLVFFDIREWSMNGSTNPEHEIQIHRLPYSVQIQCFAQTRTLPNA